MTARRLAFAVPGDLTTLTGGYIYDRRLMQDLRSQGWQVDHIALPAGFPAPSADQMSEALRRLHDVPQDIPVIIDGLAFGALDPDGVSAMKAPIVALIHHPLAKENGLHPARRDELFETERQNLSKAVHVIVPSPHTAAILSSDYGVPVQDITIAVPGTDRSSEPSTPVDPPLILSVGIQLPRKGHDVLLRALAEIGDLTWQSAIVGAALDADYAQELKDLRVSLGLEDRVQLLGQIEKSALEDLYRKASLFALATRYEGYGIVFNEALVHGLPIVSCAVGAVPDTVPAATGFLVPPGQPAAFASALRRLLSDPDTRGACALASRSAAADLPDWADTARFVSDAIAHLPQTQKVDQR